MLVWEGQGLLVIAAVVICFAIVKITSNILFGNDYFESNIWLQIATVFASGILIKKVDVYLTKRSEKEAKTYIDTDTDEKFEVKESHSLFWIPTKYWSHIVVVVGLALVFYISISPVAGDYEQPSETSEIELWGPIDMESWETTPCTSNRVAEPSDVESGTAVFVSPNSDSTNISPYKINLPKCAILNHEHIGYPTPVIVIQVESIDSFVVVGYRYIDGGYGICALDELTILNNIDSTFFNYNY
jgi:hypothetical protein